MNTVEFAFDGGTYHCRPTFKAIRAIEQATGVSCYTVGTQIIQAEISVNNLAMVVQQMLLSAGKNLSIDVIGEKIVEVGAKEFSKPAGQYCLMAFAGPKVFQEDQTPDPLPTESSSSLLQ